MNWSDILILEYIGFPMVAIPIIVMLFSRYDGYFSNIYLLGYHYTGEKILAVWQLILYGILSILPIINMVTGLCLAVNILVNFSMGCYVWNKSTVLYKFLSKKV